MPSKGPATSNIRVAPTGPIQGKQQREGAPDRLKWKSDAPMNPGASEVQKGRRSATSEVTGEREDPQVAVGRATLSKNQLNIPRPELSIGTNPETQREREGSQKKASRRFRKASLRKHETKDQSPRGGEDKDR